MATSMVALLLSLACSSCILVPITVALEDLARPDTPIGTPAVHHGALGIGTLHNDADWQPADRMPIASLDGDARSGDGPLWFASYFSVAYDRDTPSASGASQGATSFTDLGVGVRHYQAIERFEPFVGAGVVLCNRAFSAPQGDADYAYRLGLYGEAGLRFVIVPRFAIGVVWRGHITQDADLYGRDYSDEGSTWLLELVYRR